MDLKEVIIDNLNILETKLKIKHKLRTEISSSIIYGNLTIDMTIFINFYPGYIVLEFTFKNDLFLEGRLYVSEPYNHLDTFSEPINKHNKDQVKRIIDFINIQEEEILNVISELKFYIPANIRSLIKHNIDILNSVLKNNDVICEFNETNSWFDSARAQNSYCLLYYLANQPSKLLSLIVRIEANSLIAELATSDNNEIIDTIEFDYLDINSVDNFENLSELENFILDLDEIILEELKNIDYYSKTLANDIYKIVDSIYKTIQLIDSDIKLKKSNLYDCYTENYDYTFCKENMVKVDLIIRVIPEENLLMYRLDNLSKDNNQEFEILIDNINYDISEMSKFLFSKIDQIIETVNTPKIKIGIPDNILDKVYNTYLKLADDIKKINPLINYDISPRDEKYPIDLLFYQPFYKSLNLITTFTKNDSNLLIDIDLKDSESDDFISSNKITIDFNDLYNDDTINQLSKTILANQDLILESFNNP